MLYREFVDQVRGLLTQTQNPEMEIRISGTLEESGKPWIESHFVESVVFDEDENCLVLQASD